MPYIIIGFATAYIISRGDMQETIVGGTISIILAAVITWLAKLWWEARKKKKQERPKGPKQILAEKMKEIAADKRASEAHSRESQEIRLQLFDQKLHWLEELAEKKQQQWKDGQYEEDRGEATPMQVD